MGLSQSATVMHSKSQTDNYMLIYAPKGQAHLQLILGNLLVIMLMVFKKM